MDDGTALDLIGKTASLIIDGRRIDGVMVTGNQVSTAVRAISTCSCRPQLVNQIGGSGFAWIRLRSRSDLVYARES